MDFGREKTPNSDSNIAVDFGGGVFPPVSSKKDGPKNPQKINAKRTKEFV